MLKKQVSVFVLAFAILVFAFVIFAPSLFRNVDSPTNSKEVVLREVIPLEQGQSKRAERLVGVVTNVIDGDTIDVLLDNGERERVRLLGIDTPEINWQEMTADCYGFEARQFLTELIKGREVELEVDLRQGERDKYDRLLAYVTLLDSEEGNVNQTLLREGYARELTVGSSYTLRNEFVRTQGEAQVLGTGLWAACSA